MTNLQLLLVNGSNQRFEYSYRVYQLSDDDFNFKNYDQILEIDDEVPEVPQFNQEWKPLEVRNYQNLFSEHYFKSIFLDERPSLRTNCCLGGHNQIIHPQRAKSDHEPRMFRNIRRGNGRVRILQPSSALPRHSGCQTDRPVPHQLRRNVPRSAHLQRSAGCDGHLRVHSVGCVVRAESKSRFGSILHGGSQL